jgi:hypothetical protein
VGCVLAWQQPQGQVQAHPNWLMDGDGWTGGACLLSGVTSVSRLPSPFSKSSSSPSSPISKQSFHNQVHTFHTLCSPCLFRALRRVGLVSWYWGKGGVKLAWLKFNAGGVEMEMGIYISPIILTAKIKTTLDAEWSCSCSQTLLMTTKCCWDAQK